MMTFEATSNSAEQEDRYKWQLITIIKDLRTKNYIETLAVKRWQFIARFKLTREEVLLQSSEVAADTIDNVKAESILQGCLMPTASRSGRRKVRETLDRDNREQTTDPVESPAEVLESSETDLVSGSARLVDEPLLSER